MSNAVEYARKEDAIQDLKDKYASYIQLLRTITTVAVLDTLTALVSLWYGMFIDSNKVLPPVMFIITLILGFFVWAGRAMLKDEKYADLKKSIRDAEREFKYWALENPLTYE